MERFVLIIRQKKAMSFSKIETKSNLQIHKKWSDFLNKSNSMISAVHLESHGYFINDSGIKYIPYFEDYAFICSFYIIKAKNIAEATELSRNCRYIINNAIVEVRPMIELDEFKAK